VMSLLYLINSSGNAGNKINFSSSVVSKSLFVIWLSHEVLMKSSVEFLMMSVYKNYSKCHRYTT